MKQLPPGCFHAFSIRGHAVYFSWTYLLLVFLWYEPGDIARSLVGVGAVTLSILWHEFGHALTFQAFDCGPSDIILHGFGGVTQNPLGQRLSRWKHIGVSAAGPGAGLLLSVPCLIGLLAKNDWSFNTETPTYLDYFLVMMVFINIFYSVLNLLPIFPLDGGQILFRLSSYVSKNPARTTAVVSLVLIVGLGVLTFKFVGTFTIIILALLAFENYQLYQMATQRPEA